MYIQSEERQNTHLCTHHSGKEMKKGQYCRNLSLNPPCHILPFPGQVTVTTFNYLPAFLQFHLLYLYLYM
jgi:hypothetical protein